MRVFQNKYKMDIQSADTTLQNIFAVVGQTPNRIPFDKLLLRQMAVLRPYNIMLGVALSMLVFTILCPIYFYSIKPSGTTGQHVTIGDHRVENDTIYIELVPSYIMVDLKETYLVTASGITSYATDYDYETSTICFPYYDEECNIYIQSDDGTTLHLLFSPFK